MSFKRLKKRPFLGNLSKAFDYFDFSVIKLKYYGLENNPVFFNLTLKIESKKQALTKVGHGVLQGSILDQFIVVSYFYKQSAIFSFSYKNLICRLYNLPKH